MCDLAVKPLHLGTGLGEAGEIVDRPRHLLPQPDVTPLDYLQLRVRSLKQRRVYLQLGRVFPLLAGLPVVKQSRAVAADHYVEHATPPTAGIVKIAG